MNSLVTVRSYASRGEASVAKGVLESEGIEAFIFADDAGGLYPMVLSSCAALKVHSEDGEKAKNVLKTFQKNKKEG